MLRRPLLLALGLLLVGGVALWQWRPPASAARPAPHHQRFRTRRLLVSPRQAPRPLSRRARGVFLRHSITFVLPSPLPAGASAQLAGSRDGTAPISVDDAARVTLATSHGVRSWTLNFARSSRSGITPHAPLDLTSALRRGGRVTLTLELEDLYPPTCSATPFFLILRLPVPPPPPPPRPKPGPSVPDMIAAALRQVLPWLGAIALWFALYRWIMRRLGRMQGRQIARAARQKREASATQPTSTTRFPR